jgi:hypothetical protein
MFGRKKNDSDTLVLDENEEFYNPPASDAPRVVNNSELLPIDDEDDDAPEEDDAPKKERRKKAKRYGRVIEEEEVEEEEPEASEWQSPVKPSLSLPSRSIVELTLRDGASVRMRKVMVIVGAGLAAALVTCAGLNIFSTGQLKGVEAEGQTLANQVKALQPVADYFDGYSQRKEAVSEVLTTDVKFSAVQNGLFTIAAKNGVSVTSETIAPGEPCKAIDPFAAAEGLGCATAQISGNSAGDLSKVADEINNQQGLGGAYISGISSKDGKTISTLSFNYDDKLLSERYQKFGSKSGSSSNAKTPETGSKG